MGKRLARSALGGIRKRPVFFIGFFLAALLLVCFWDSIVTFTDRYPLIRIILSAEWAISRYERGEKFFNLSNHGFYFFLLAKNVMLWIFWLLVFSRVSPGIAKNRGVQNIFRYFTLENHQKNFFSHGLTQLVLWGTKHRTFGRLISGAFYFAFGFVSHGDIPAIGVAIGFKQWWAVLVVLAAMLCKITFWSHLYLHFP